MAAPARDDNNQSTLYLMRARRDILKDENGDGDNYDTGVSHGRCLSLRNLGLEKNDPTRIKCGQRTCEFALADPTMLHVPIPSPRSPCVGQRLVHMPFA